VKELYGIQERMHSSKNEFNVTPPTAATRHHFCPKIYTKSGRFLRPEKAPCKTPRVITNPPQLHHDLPSKNTPKSSKNPAKTISWFPRIFSSA
jgi:hypothetical protein